MSAEIPQQTVSHNALSTCLVPEAAGDLNHLGGSCQVVLPSLPAPSEACTAASLPSMTRPARLHAHICMLLYNANEADREAAQVFLSQQLGSVHCMLRTHHKDLCDAWECSFAEHPAIRPAMKQTQDTSRCYPD